MNKAEKLKARLLARQGYHNFSFADARAMLKGLGFRLDRQEGSHQVWQHPAVAAPVNIQDFKGKAKPYQLDQIRKIVREHKL
ncbi:MAG: type II toxin-antitoxin system HicA family toxin [Opitutaceae bacterium]